MRARHSTFSSFEKRTATLLEGRVPMFITLGLMRYKRRTMDRPTSSVQMHKISKSPHVTQYAMMRYWI